MFWIHIYIYIYIYIFIKYMYMFKTYEFLKIFKLNIFEIINCTS